MTCTGYIVQLPKEKWYRCDFCGGSGSIEMSEDCHRSAGIIPCSKCGRDGIVRQEVISPEEFRMRNRIERKVWAKPSFTEVS